MLEFSPNKRISAEEALEDSYFDDVRLEEQEEFDILNVDMSFIDKYQENEVPQSEIKKMIIEMIQKLSQNVDDDVQQFVDLEYE